ncbi:MAG: hypothetical protein JNL28_12255 [Planctomycetes bacterium]|nr:hypothetical protein [Planctomycetota bacterium]
MKNTETAYFASQLAHMAPALLVYVVAAVLAIVFWSRSRAAAILTLLAAFVLSSVAIISPLVHTYLMSLHNDGTLTSQVFSTRMSVVALASTFFHTLGIALLVAAVFVGRSRAAAAPEHAAHS